MSCSYPHCKGGTDCHSQESVLTQLTLYSDTLTRLNIKILQERVKARMHELDTEYDDLVNPQAYIEFTEGLITELRLAIKKARVKPPSKPVRKTVHKRPYNYMRR